MFFLKWLALIAVSALSVYVTIWLAGGWGHWLFTSTRTLRSEVVVGLAALGFLVVGSILLILAVAVQDEVKFFNGWSGAGALWVFVSFMYGTLLDPITVYGPGPWQWLTWWTVLPFLFGIFFIIRVVGCVGMERGP